MGLFPIVGVVVMGILGAAFEVPSPGKFQTQVPKSVLEQTMEEDVLVFDEKDIRRIVSSVDTLVKASSSVADGLSRMQSMMEKNQKRISEMADDVSRIKSMVKENQKSIPDMAVCAYKLTVYTGDVEGAGTNEDVIVQLIGEQGVSQELYPDSIRNDFERGQADVFLLEVPRLGTLTEIKVNCSEPNVWFLDKIVVNKANFRENYTFHYNNWINGLVRIFPSSEKCRDNKDINLQSVEELTSTTYMKRHQGFELLSCL